MKIGYQLLLAIAGVFAAHCARAEDLSSCMAGWAATESKQFDEAIRLYQQCIVNGALSEASLARTYRNMGITLRDAGRPNEAVAYYRKAIALKPFDVEDDWVNLGNAQDEANDFQAALQSYAKAFHVHPEYGEAYYNRGIAYERRKDYVHAKVDFLAAYKAGLRTGQLYERLVVHGLVSQLQQGGP